MRGTLALTRQLKSPETRTFLQLPPSLMLTSIVGSRLSAIHRRLRNTVVQHRHLPHLTIHAVAHAMTLNLFPLLISRDFLDPLEILSMKLSCVGSRPTGCQQLQRVTRNFRVIPHHITPLHDPYPPGLVETVTVYHPPISARTYTLRRKLTSIMISLVEN